jgi:hypothetical protein
MKTVKNFYGSLIDLIGYIVSITSDQGADIAIRALPILAPLPNAISLFYVSQTVLHFGDWQAKAFATSIELALFGLFEVVLKMFDGFQTKPKLYKGPFYLACGVAVFIMLLIIAVVAVLEHATPILAALPLFSAAGATALALRRWHERNMKAEEKQTDDLNTALSNVRDERNRLDETVQTLQEEVVTQKQSIEIVLAERRQAQEEIERLSKLMGQLAAKNIPETPTEKRPTGEDAAKEKLFDILDREASGDLPKQKRQDLYKQIGVPRTRMYEMIKQWTEQNPSIENVSDEPIIVLNGAH